MLSGPAGIASSSFQLRLKYPKTRSKEPSGLRIQPSKYGTTSCPLENFVAGSSVGSCCALSALKPSTTSAAAPSRTHLFIGLQLSLVHALLVLGVVDVEQADPRKAHLVDSALAVADPVPRVRVVLVGGGVVVPRGDVDDRPRRENRRDIVGVGIGDVPAELIVADAVDRLGPRRPRARRVG